MKNLRYPLTYDSWDKKEIIAINKVIKSNKFTMGENVKKFERKFSDFIGSKYSVMVNSGSSANLLSFASLIYSKKYNFKKNDEIIVPALSWSTSYSPIHQMGFKMKIVDIDQETLNYDLDQLKKAVTKNTKAILVVNVLGNPNNFRAINKIIKNKKIVIIEDNCESLGSQFGNKFLGTFGELGTFSFFYSHHISTIEGGMIVTNNRELYHIILSLRAHGWTRDLPNKNEIYEKKTQNFDELFNFILPGYNLRSTEINASVGLEQLKKLNKFIIQRRKNADIFKKLFQNHKYIKIQKEIGKSSWFGFSLIVKKNSTINRNTIIKLLTKNNIEVRPIIAGNIVTHQFAKYMNYKIYNKLSNADYLNKNGFFVGNSHKNLKYELKKLRKILDF